MRSLFLMLPMLLGACAAAPPASAPSGAMACAVDGDCAVKNVGSCCGYYPQCVNIAHQPDAAAAQAACVGEGRSSVCGYPEIRGCRCVEGRCAASDAASAPN